MAPALASAADDRNHSRADEIRGGGFRDGSRVVTSQQTAGPRYALISQRSDGNGAPDTLLPPSRTEAWPTDMSPGDSLLLYYGNAPGEPQNVFVLDLRTKTSRRITMQGSQRGARLLISVNH